MPVEQPVLDTNYKHLKKSNTNLAKKKSERERVCVFACMCVQLKYVQMCEINQKNKQQQKRCCLWFDDLKVHEVHTPEIRQSP